MDRRHSLTHPFGSRVSRITGIAMGLTLLWYGSSQISVAGLVMMLIGLIAAVGAAVPPRLSLAAALDAAEVTRYVPPAVSATAPSVPSP